MDLNQNNSNAKVRSNLLTFLCILTFIGSGLSSFANFMVFSTFDEMQIAIEEIAEKFPAVLTIFKGGRQFFLAGFILNTISLLGALQMWKLRKIGFHIYTAAQLFILILPAVVIDTTLISIFEIMITMAFVFGYFSQLKLMT